MKREITLIAAAAMAISSSVPVSAASPWIVENTATKTECSACHTIYAPGFLPKRSWQAIMGDLGNHFGEDASLDEATRSEIELYLVAMSSDNPRGVNPASTPLRITELSWFNNEHGARARAAAAARPEIGTISNCTACHSGAERGQFGD